MNFPNFLHITKGWHKSSPLSMNYWRTTEKPAKNPKVFSTFNLIYSFYCQNKLQSASSSCRFSDRHWHQSSSVAKPPLRVPLSFPSADGPIVIHFNFTNDLPPHYHFVLFATICSNSHQFVPCFCSVLNQHFIFCLSLYNLIFRNLKGLGTGAHFYGTRITFQAMISKPPQFDFSDDAIIDWILSLKKSTTKCNLNLDFFSSFKSSKID